MMVDIGGAIVIITKAGMETRVEADITHPDAANSGK